MLESEITLQNDIINKIHNFLQTLYIGYSSEHPRISALQLKKLLSSHEKLLIFSNIIKSNICSLQDQNIIGLNGKFAQLDYRKIILYNTDPLRIFYDEVTESLLILYGTKTKAIGYFIPIKYFSKYFNDIKVLKIDEEFFITYSNIPYKPNVLSKKHLVISRRGILKNAMLNMDYLSIITIDDFLDLIFTEFCFVFFTFALLRVSQQEKQNTIFELEKSNSFYKNSMVRSKEILDIFANRILEFYRIYDKYDFDIFTEDEKEINVFDIVERSIRLNTGLIEKLNIRFFNQTKEVKFKICFSRMIFEKIILSFLEIILQFLTRNKFIKFSCIVTISEVVLIAEDNGLDLDFTYLENKSISKIDEVSFYNWRDLEVMVENFNGTLFIKRESEIRKTTLTFPLQHSQKYNNYENIIPFNN